MKRPTIKICRKSQLSTFIGGKVYKSAANYNGKLQIRRLQNKYIAATNHYARVVQEQPIIFSHLKTWN